MDDFHQFSWVQLYLYYIHINGLSLSCITSFTIMHSLSKDGLPIHYIFVFSTFFLTPKCPRPVLNFFEFDLNWTRSNHFDKFYQFFWNCNCRNSNCILKIIWEKKTQQCHLWIEGLWCLIMRVLNLWKWFEVFQSSFHMSDLKIWSPKNMRLNPKFPRHQNVVWKKLWS